MNSGYGPVGNQLEIMEFFLGGQFENGLKGRRKCEYFSSSKTFKQKTLKLDILQIQDTLNRFARYPKHRARNRNLPGSLICHKMISSMCPRRSYVHCTCFELILQKTQTSRMDALVQIKNLIKDFYKFDFSTYYFLAPAVCKSRCVRLANRRLVAIGPCAVGGDTDAAGGGSGVCCAYVGRAPEGGGCGMGWLGRFAQHQWDARYVPVSDNL